MKGLRHLALFVTLCWLSGLQCNAQNEFEQFSQDFTNKVRSSFGDEAVTSKDSLSLFMTKQVITNSVETQINKSQIQLHATIPKYSFKDPDTIVIKTPKLEIKACDFHCPNCGGCGWCVRNPGCCLAKGACEVAKAACYAAQAPLVAQCKAINAIASTASEKEVAILAFSNVMAEGEANITPIRVAILPDPADNRKFNSTLTSNMSASVRASGKIDLTLKPVAGLLAGCVSNNLTFTVNPTPINITAQSVSFGSKFDLAEEDGAKLSLSVTKTTINVQTNISPFLTFLRDNVFELAKCPVPGALLGQALLTVGTFDQLFPIVRDIDFPVDGDFAKIPVGHITMEMPGRVRKPVFRTTINNLSVGIVERPPIP